MATVSASSPAEPEPRLRWWRGLGPHVVVLALALVALAPSMDIQTSWVADEGAYGLEVHSLQRGTWEYDYVARAADPAGNWFPIRLGEGVGGTHGRFYAYLKHPLDVILPWLAVSLSGSGLGYDLPSMLGALLTAVAAWLISAEWHRRAAPLAFWLAAMSPVAVNAYLIWPHALSAGIAGLTLWAAIRAWRVGWRTRWGVATLVGACTGVLLRPEGLLFAVAVGLAIGAALFGRGARRAAVALGGLTIVSAYLCHRIEEVGVSWLIERTYVAQGDTVRGANQLGANQLGYVVSRLQGAERDLLAGSEYTTHAHDLVAIALIVLVVAGLALRTRRKRRAWFVVPLLVGVLWLYHLRFQANPLEAAMGLLAAWPVLVIALMCIRRPKLWSVEFQLCMVVALFVAAIVATDYSIGGGLEWGGRFFSPVLAPLAALAASALWVAVEGMGQPGRRVTAIALAALVLLPPAYGLNMLRTYRLEKDTLYNELADRAGGVVVADGPAFRELPRAAWRLDPRIHWLFVEDDHSASMALAALHELGIEQVMLLTTQGTSPLTVAPYRDVADVSGPATLLNSTHLLRLRSSAPSPGSADLVSIGPSVATLPQVNAAVDGGRRIGDQILVHGWFLPGADNGGRYGLAFATADGSPSRIYESPREARPDVAATLHLTDQLTGFSVVVPLQVWLTGQAIVVERQGSAPPRVIGRFRAASSWPVLGLP